MPGEYSQFAAGFREVVFFVPEVTYGVPVHPSPTHAAIIQTTDFTFAHERVNREDKTTSRSYTSRISHRKSVDWSATLYTLPSGTNGVPPDITDALEAAMGTKRVVPNGTRHAATASSTTSLPLEAGEGANYQVGDAVGWVNALGELEVSFVETIAVDVLTISPPFSEAPGVGTTIRGSVTYKLANAIGQLTITRVVDNIVQVFPGCFVNDLTLEFPSEGEGTMTVGGNGKTEFLSGVSTLGVAALVGDGTLTVATGEGIRFDLNTRVLVNAEGANTDEVVLVTGRAGDVLTVTRAQAGTAASAHGIGAVVGPYQPASTTAGIPVSGTVGQAVITGLNGATRVLSTARITSFSTSMNNQGSLRNNVYGLDSAIGFFVNKREVSFSLTFWLEKENVKMYNTAKQFTTQEVMVQLGMFQGQVCAVKIDRGEFNIPGIDAGGDEDVMLPIEGMGLGSPTGGNDELVVAFL